jgi:hypothetical protein
MEAFAPIRRKLLLKELTALGSATKQIWIRLSTPNQKI